MRRWITPLIVVGVAAVAVFAAADALRGHDEPRASAESDTEATITKAEAPNLLQILRRDAVTGFLLYSDGNCRLHSLLLPRMEDDVIREENGEPLVRCRFESGAGRILEENERISPDRQLIAACRGGQVEVRIAESGRQLYNFRGCPPAWRPDGALTYPQGDRIMDGEVVLFSARELRAAARTHPNLIDYADRIFVHATDLAWIDEDRLIVSLEAQARFVEPQYLTVVFLGKQILSAASRFGQPAGGWFASPAGSLAAASDGTIVTRGGDFTDPPDNLPEGRAVAFSADEEWLVYTTGVSIYLVGTPRNSEPGRIIQLPIVAEDVVWEPSGVNATGTSTAAR